MRRALAVGILLAAAASASAAEVRRQFVFRLPRNQPELTERLNAQLPGWVASIPTDLAPGDAWDETAAGPFDLVLGRLSVRLEKSSDTTARIRIALDDSGLRSGSATVDALTRRVIAYLRAEVGGAASEERETRRAALQTSLGAAEAGQQRVEDQLRELESLRGDPSVQRTLLIERMRVVQGQLADARIQEAVLERQLARARDAAKRALEVARLEREVGEIETVVEQAAERGSIVAAERTAKLRTLRQELDLARSETPSIDTVRERIFDLEVGLTAEAGRSELLAEELKELAETSADVLAADRRHRELVADLERHRTRRDTARRALEAFEVQTTSAAFELLGRATPDTDEQR